MNAPLAPPPYGGWTHAAPAIITPAGLRRIVLGSTEGERLAGSRSAQHTAAKPVRSAGPFNQTTLVVTHAERGALDRWCTPGDCSRSHIGLGPG